MKPVIILPPDAVSVEDIALLNANDLCVVVAKDPSMVKFVDPLPAASSRTEMEHAAIQLSRMLLNGHWSRWSGTNMLGRGDFARMFVDLLVEGTPLDPNPTRAEQEAVLFSDAKREEIRRLAREEAREERKAKKGTHGK